MASRNGGPMDIMDEYLELRSVPALLSIVFALLTAMQFGIIAAPEILIMGGYIVTEQHGFMLSLGVLALAFFSSEARSFEKYRQWEQGVMGAGILLVIGTRFVSEVNDLVMTNELSQLAAFGVAFAAWGVLIR